MNKLNETKKMKYLTYKPYKNRDLGYSIALNAKGLRKSKGLSFIELVEATGIPQTVLSRLEAGVMGDELDLKDILMLTHFYEITVKDLIKRVGYKPRQVDKIRRHRYLKLRRRVPRL